jgi:hypothetical protein
MRQPVPVIAAFFSFLIIGFLASSGAAAYITYAMVQEVNLKRGRELTPRKWDRDLIGIISDYRDACPKGRLLWPLAAALLFFLMTGAGLFATFSRIV